LSDAPVNIDDRRPTPLSSSISMSASPSLRIDTPVGPYIVIIECAL
jgi:hypothetical protein